MTPDEVRAAITYANGIDPRVQMTQPNAEVWGRCISHRTAAEARAAIQVYYERPRDGRERPPIDGPTIKRIIADETNRLARQQQAIDAKPPSRNPSGWRARNPAEWDRLVIQGRDDRRAELRARGIAPQGAKQDG